MSAVHVIFDCDGVLVDSETLANRVMLEVLAERGLVMTDEEADEHFLGHTLPACIDIASRLLGRPLDDAFLEELETRSRAVFDRELAPVPGVREVLDALPVPASCASNSSRAGLARKLRRTGLHHYFAGRLYCYEDVRAPKPAPDMYLLAASRAGVEAARCVVVEDSATGVRAARAAGMRVFGFERAGGRALAEAGAEPFADMAELPALIAAAVRGEGFA